MSQQRQHPEAIPIVSTFQVGEDTPWPNTMPASTNLFKARADWAIPPTKTPAVKMEKADSSTQGSCHPPMLWFWTNLRTINQWKKCVNGHHTTPFAKRKKKVQRTGMVTDKKASRETITPQTLNDLHSLWNSWYVFSTD